jgi:hypothetical protein
MIIIQSVCKKEGLVLARDENKQWYEVINKDDVQIGQKVDSSFCTPLSESDSQFHEGIKELTDAAYGPLEFRF